MAIKKCLIQKTTSDDGEGNRTITAVHAYIVDAVVGGSVISNYRGPRFEGWTVNSIMGEPTGEELARARYMDRCGWDATPFGLMTRECEKPGARTSGAPGSTA